MFPSLPAGLARSARVASRDLMPCRGTLLVAVVLTGTALLAGNDAAGQDQWPGWRGTDRGAIAPDFEAPDSWPSDVEGLRRHWSVEVGEGHAGPVVADDRVYVFSRVDEHEVVRCLELEDGGEIWSQRYEVPYRMHQAARGHGKGPKSTPQIAEDTLVTFGISGILSAWTLQGEERWQVRIDPQTKGSPLFGTAMSPLVLQPEDQILVHLGGHDDGSLVAKDITTGEAEWSWDEDGPAYTSPIEAELAGHDVLITQTQKHNVVFARDGRLLWSEPFETRYVQNIVTPVVYGDTVIFSGFGEGTHAIAFSPSDDGGLESEHAWHNPEISMYMSSPVLRENRLYGFSQTSSGQLFCIDVASGETSWEGPGRQADNGLLVSAGGVLAALLTSGELLFFADDDGEYRELARYQVSQSPCWAHPVFLGNRILFKDLNTLHCIEIPRG